MTPEPVFILTLGLDSPTFERLDALRRAHFPPERNFIPAHVSLFHHLTAPVEGPIEAAAARDPIALRFSRVHRLGRGAAFAVESPDLQSVHVHLARTFADQLTPQDRQPFRPHVTIQNKAQPEVALATLEMLSAGFTPWTGTGVSFLLWRYLGGPWELEREFFFTKPPSSRTE